MTFYNKILSKIWIVKIYITVIVLKGNLMFLLKFGPAIFISIEPFLDF